MSSGIKPWTRELALCGSWLGIILEELKLRGHELSVTEVNALAVDAATVRERAEAVSKSLRDIARSRSGAA